MDLQNTANLTASSVCVCVTLIAATAVKYINSKRKKFKKCWSRSWIARRNVGRGVLNMLNTELKPEDPEAYRNFLRLSTDQFEYLLTLITPMISKKDTVMRKCITARDKLGVTLRYLATGESFRSLMYSTRIHESTISKFIPLVCQAICMALKDMLKTPRSTEEWLKISDDFNIMWQFPHCLGALDGRHIEFRPPISAGSYYYNYKGRNSIVLLALVDARYRFTYVNVGINGRISDGGVFYHSGLSKAIANDELHFPSPSVLSGQHQPTPYVIVADDAFPLLKNVMKPYPERGLTHEERIFNYRLSRARRIVENAFGILANRFRVLLNPIGLSVDKVERITLACVLLHNFLTTSNDTHTHHLEEHTKPQMPHIGPQSGNKSSQLARDIRDNLKNYFVSAQGCVSWQEASINNFQS